MKIDAKEQRDMYFKLIGCQSKHRKAKKQYDIIQIFDTYQQEKILWIEDNQVNERLVEEFFKINNVTQNDLDKIFDIIHESCKKPNFRIKKTEFKFHEDPEDGSQFVEYLFYIETFDNRITDWCFYDDHIDRLIDSDVWDLCTSHILVNTQLW